MNMVFAFGPAPVGLATAVNYVILAQTGISTVPTSAISSCSIFFICPKPLD